MTSTFPDTEYSCVIMASGLGVRFGGNKLMADFGNKPMVSHIIDHATECFDEVVVVTRNTGVLELCKSRGIKAVYHDLPYRSDTIRLGIENISKVSSGVFFCLADQPFLSTDTLYRLMEAADSAPDSIWRVACDGTIGSPTYFPRRYFDELSSLPEDKGGSYVCKNHPDDIRILNVENPLELTDIDTREIYEELLPLASSLNVWNSFIKSGKKHLLITGYRGSGKTTLLRSLRPIIGNKTWGLTSFAIKGVEVRLVNDRTHEEIIIGRYIPEDNVKDNKMSPDIVTMDTKGVAFVEELIASGSSWVTIDEIGYLEEFSDMYKDALRRLLDVKRVVSVIRKENLEFLTELINREDAYVIDLDLKN